MTIEGVFGIIGVAVLLVGVIVYLVRQRGGEGPEVGEVPRVFRPWVNAWYGVNRWPIPYDGEGNLIPVEDRRRAS